MRYVITFLVFLLSLSVAGQSNKTSVDTTGKKDIVKKGWNLLPFPFITFDTDLGVEFGVSTTAVDFGDGKEYPGFYHMMFLSASVYTKGSATMMFNYESNHLIKGVETLFDVAYLPDMAFDFYGFNGYESVFNASWIDDKSPDYRSRLFYKLKRKMLRVRSTFVGKMGEGHFKWLTGLEFYNVNMASLNIDRFNKGKEGKDKLPSVDSVPPLYNRYVHWGLIPENEKNGGFFTILKAGIVYDTRDNEHATMKGIWTEAVLVGAPKFMSSMNKGFLKLAVYWRHYVPLIRNRLTFAYRLNYQGTIAGHIPYYAQTFKFNSVANGLYNEGLGGGKTLRGVLRNRVVGDGVVMGNFELRLAFWKFILFKQNISMVASGFFDTGKVIQFIDVHGIIDNLTDKQIDYMHVGDTKSDYFNVGAERFHNTAGAGLHIIVNHNIVLAFDFAKAFNKQDNNGLGVYIGSYFLF